METETKVLEDGIREPHKSVLHLLQTLVGHMSLQ